MYKKKTEKRKKDDKERSSVYYRELRYDVSRCIITVGRSCRIYVRYAHFVRRFGKARGRQTRTMARKNDFQSAERRCTGRGCYRADTVLGGNHRYDGWFCKLGYNEIVAGYRRNNGREYRYNRDKLAVEPVLGKRHGNSRSIHPHKFHSRSGAYWHCADNVYEIRQKENSRYNTDRFFASDVRNEFNVRRRRGIKRQRGVREHYGNVLKSVPRSTRRRVAYRRSSILVGFNRYFANALQ